MIYALIAAWFVTGMAGFAFWWTTKHDLKTGEIPIMIFTGLVGPFAWAIGYLIHGDSSKVLLNKRTK